MTSRLGWKHGDKVVFTGAARLGNFLPRKLRRLLLDRLGGARVVAWVAKDKFVQAKLLPSTILFANPIYHAGMIKGGHIAYEQNVVAVLNQVVREGMVFYDVGANIGVFSFFAAELVGAKGRVIAFEPEPNNTVCLKKSIEHNSAFKRIDLLELGLWDEDGTAAFDRRGGAFSGRIVDERTVDGAAAAVVTVTVRSIDSLVAGGKIPPPDFLKIDVEGGEGKVLAGARRTISAHRPSILLEAHSFAGESVGQSFRILDQADYRLLGLPQEGDAGLLPLDEASRYEHRHILAVPREG